MKPCLEGEDDARRTVSAVRTPKNPSGKEIEGAIRKAFDLIGGLDDIVSRKDLVLINPSWAAPPTDPQSAVITSPEVTKAIADIIGDFGGRPIIAESSAVGQCVPPETRGKRVTIQGLGAVEYELAKQLAELKVGVWGTDIDGEKEKGFGASSG